MFSKREQLSPGLKIILSFAKACYPDLSLQPKMLEQLTWLQSNSVHTSQSDAKAKEDPVNIEVKRILSRLNSFNLLLKGGSGAYSKFTESQKEEDRLSEENFNRLSRFIQGLAPDLQNCLMATCFITKSDAAIQSVDATRRAKLPTDSEQFITHMVIHFPNNFPISGLLTPEQVGLLPYAFYKDCHARHILDMEGGYNMFAHLAKAINEGKISREQYNLWFSRWIINIAGLDGHINHKGSSYLIEPVANCIWALKQELDKLWSDAGHNVVDEYLAFRKEQLQVNSLYTAYLGALMRQYTPEMGAEIQAWFDDLTDSERQEKTQVFQNQLRNTKTTPTYKPTVLVNLMQFGCTVADALTIFAKIESQVSQLYAEAIETGRLSENTPLCYRGIAFREYLMPLKEYHDRENSLPILTLSADGYLSIDEEALKAAVSIKGCK